MNIDDPRINKFNERLVRITNTHYMISFWPLPWGWERPNFERWGRFGEWRFACGPLFIEKMVD